MKIATPANNNVGTIVLAAGGSRRLGRPKQLLPYGGRSLVARVVDQVLEVNAGPIVVVTGAVAAVTALLPAQVAAIDNPDWHLGMGSSVTTGLSGLLALEPAIPAAMIVLADQPLITPSHLRSLISWHKRCSSSPTPVVATTYGNGPGVPALFPVETFSLLAELRADSGARELLRSGLCEVHAIAPDFDVMDIDTEQDYQQLLNQVSQARL